MKTAHIILHTAHIFLGPNLGKVKGDEDLWSEKLRLVSENIILIMQYSLCLHNKYHNLKNNNTGGGAVAEWLTRQFC